MHQPADGAPPSHSWREARALARLDHPHIVKVHDFGEENGRLHLILEYASGGDVAGRAPVPVAQAVQIVLSPGQNLIGSILGPGRKLASLVKAIEEKLEKGAAIKG